MPMLPTTRDLENTGANHPLALRMGVIAFLNQAITAGCTWGSFSVLLGANEARLGISRELSTLAIPAMMLTTACLAPVAGMLAAKYPMRRVAMFGAICSLAGFLVLALTNSYPLYLAAFGLLLGPGMAIGVIMPATLVTRWFKANRGKALGLVNIPVLFTLLPLVTTWALHSYGLRQTYLMLTAFSLVTVIANSFITDPPASTITADAAPGVVSGDAKADAAGGSTLKSLLLNRRFWTIAIGANASVVGSIVLTTHMVPMAMSWGNTATEAATLLSIMSMVAMVGTVFFGWLTDRLGGALTLALLILDSAFLWALLLVHPPFPVLLVIIGLIGFHAVGAGPVLGISLSEVFGEKEFSRAYGMANLVGLPLTMLAVPAAALIFSRSGSYAGVVIAEVAFLLITLPAVFSIRRKRRFAIAS
jgi:MFS family permease